MYLFISILLSTLLGYLLLMMGPLIGGFLAFGIITGSLFRGLYLLNDIQKSLSTFSPKQNKVTEAHDRHVNENRTKFQE